MVSIMTAVRHRLFYTVSHVLEKIRGVDFTLPDRMYDRKRNDGAMYYASPNHVLRSVLSEVNVRKYDCFLDVGCGKGSVLRTVSEYGFRRIGGIEYDDRLARICMRNMQRVGLSGKVRVACCDAAVFRHYGDYNCFYFYNPFMEGIMDKVMQTICSECSGREILIVYYHPRYCGVIEETGFFQRIRTIYDRGRDYEIYIYRGIPGVPAERRGKQCLSA